MPKNYDYGSDEHDAAGYGASEFGFGSGFASDTPTRATTTAAPTDGPADEFGFWAGERQPTLGRRAHGSVAPRRPGRARRDAGGQPNPLVRRLGALCAVGLLAVPVALVVRGSDDDVRLSTEDATAVTEVEVLAPVTVPAALAAAVAAVPVDGQSPIVAPVITVAISTAPFASAVSAAPTTAAPVPTVAETVAPITVAPTTAAPVTTVVATVAPTTAAPTTAAPTTAAPATTAVATPTTTARPTIAVAQVVEIKHTCAIDYKVAAGDYWISIARRAEVKLAALLTANGAKATTPLYPGTKICLPAGATIPTATTAVTPTTAKPSATTTPTTTKPKPTATTATPTTAAPTTAVPTTVAPSTTAAPPKNNYTKAQVEQIIRDVWPDDLEDEAVRIATRESNLIPTVRNSCCFGLFQIYFNANKSSLVSWGITSAPMLYDPTVNAFAAYAMYLRAGGWGPWSM